MGIARRLAALSPALRTRPVGWRTPRPTPEPLANLRDRPSGCFSNQHRQLLRVETLDAKWQIHQAFARRAAGRRGRGRVRGASDRGLYAPQRPRQFPLRPYTPLGFGWSAGRRSSGLSLLPSETGKVRQRDGFGPSRQRTQPSRRAGAGDRRSRLRLQRTGVSRCAPSMLIVATLCALTLAQAASAPSPATPAPEQSAAPEPISFSEVVCSENRAQGAE
jgi:hypothetical protein